MFILFIKKKWLPISLFTLTAIIILSLWPRESLPVAPGGDKTHHLLAYGALIFPVALRQPKRWYLIALGFAIFGGLIELIQPYVNRHGEWLDFLANLGGLLCGTILATLLKKLEIRNRKNFII